MKPRRKLGRIYQQQPERALDDGAALEHAVLPALREMPTQGGHRAEKMPVPPLEFRGPNKV